MPVWNKTKKKLQDALPPSAYKLWIEPLADCRVEGTCLHLACPDRYFKAYLSHHYLDLIVEKTREVDTRLDSVNFFVEAAKQPSTKPEPAQMRLPSLPENNSSYRSLHPRYTFDDFMVGESNILAQSACRSMSVFDDTFGPCLYINSSTGLGKTHLTHAIAHQVLNAAPMTRLYYLTAQQFAAEMVGNIKANSMEAFKRKYHDKCDILLVEDMQSLTGKKKTQEELNEVLDTLIKSGKKIVMTANRSPRDLSGIDDDFRSRMSSGLVTSIQKPDYETRRRIIRRRALQQNVHLEEAFVAYLAEQIKGDVRSIESAIVAIGARASLNMGVVDERMLEEVVLSLVGAVMNLSAQSISELVSRQFKVGMNELQSRSRTKKVAFPRQVAMYLSRKHTEETLSEIGKVFNRDHSTVMHAIKVITDLSRRDNSISAQLDYLSDKLNRL